MSRGLALLALGHREDAQRVLEGAVALAEAAADLDSLARALDNLSNVHYFRGEFDQSRVYLERGLKEAAGSRDIRLGGGANTIRQYLNARLIDELHLALSPLLLGSGEALFAGIDLLALRYRVSKHMGTGNAMHVVITRE